MTNGYFGDWLYDVDCVSGATCFGASGAGLLRTSDLGATWSVLSVPAGLLVSTLSCIDDQHCAVIGSSPTGLRFLTTVDGGASWASNLPIAGSPRKLRCATSLFCVVATDDGVMRSTDGGAAWTPFSVSTHISAVECPGVTVCVAVGSNILEVFGPTIHTEFTTIVGTGQETLACPSVTKCVIFDFAFGTEGAVTIDLSSGVSGGVSLPAELGQVNAGTCIAGRCIAVGESIVAGAASSNLAVTAFANDPYNNWTGTANAARIEQYIGLACATENIGIIVGSTGQQSTRSCRSISTPTGSCGARRTAGRRGRSSQSRRMSA